MTVTQIPYLTRNHKHHALSGLMQQPWAMLMDSAGQNLDYNRFDIFCCQPSATLSFDGKISTIVSEDTLPKVDTKKPLDCLKSILDFYRLLTNESNNKDEIPFRGGWMGYISYDFGRYLESLPDLTDDDIQLPQVQMGLYQWALISDHKQQTTRLYNFGLNDRAWQSVNKLVTEAINLNQSQAELNEFSLTTRWQSNIDQPAYHRAFNRIQDYIHAGDCYQVNFAQQFSADYSGSAYTAYTKLTEANQAPFSAFLNFADHQILSLSPERFIESHNRKVITQPIKGTRPRSADKNRDAALAEELKNSDKDRAENLMIVDLLRNDLSRTAAKGSVKVSELFGHYRFESVHHLISTIESELDDSFDNFDLLATTLPGGSITGAPKIRAMEIIEELEPVKRNLYCGIIGYLDFANNMDTNICIRTLIAKNNRLYCWAGGGLVADSEVETEYQETFDKLAKILPVLEN